MRWPGSWSDPSLLSLLEGTSINFLVSDGAVANGDLGTRAQNMGIRVGEISSPPAGVTIVPGDWPGVRISRSGGLNEVSSGPTGRPWVDSNGWRIRLAAAMRATSNLWIDAAPKGPQSSAEHYVLAIADSAAYGGRWIISLDDRLAAGIADRKPDATETWRRISQATGFFAARTAWCSYHPEAVVGVVSDFAGPNKVRAQEILNLLARTNEQYRIVRPAQGSADSLKGLKAVLCVDTDQPPAPLRQQILSFVKNGGLMIGGPNWSELPGKPVNGDHPRYASQLFGKGRIAIARKQDFLNDPYLAANDAVLLIGHRCDLLRFWNEGAAGAYVTRDADRKRVLAQMLFYAPRGPRLQRGEMGDYTTVWIAGRYRTAKFWALDRTAPQSIEIHAEKDGTEIHLPPVSQYAAVELETQ